MSWLKRIFSRQISSQPEPAESQVMRLDDQSYYSNSDIVDGMQFSATLQIRTPLEVLKHHGELFRGPPSQAPQYGSQADGIWTFKTRTYRELGIAVDEPEHTHASDAGAIKPSLYLPFLIQFRTIVESASTHEEKLAQLALLPQQSVQFKAIWRKLSAYYDDFPASFFYLPFVALPGVGKQLARRLYEAGFRTPDEIVNASISRLTAVSGLGKATAAKIKAKHTSPQEQ